MFPRSRSFSEFSRSRYIYIHRDFICRICRVDRLISFLSLFLSLFVVINVSGCSNFAPFMRGSRRTILSPLLRLSCEDSRAKRAQMEYSRKGRENIRKSVGKRTAAERTPSVVKGSRDFSSSRNRRIRILVFPAIQYIHPYIKQAVVPSLPTLLAK